MTKYSIFSFIHSKTIHLSESFTLYQVQVSKCLALPLLLFTPSQQLTTRQFMDKLSLHIGRVFFLVNHYHLNFHIMIVLYLIMLPSNFVSQNYLNPEISITLSNLSLSHPHHLSQVSLQQRLLLFFKPNIYHVTLLRSLL